MLTKNQNGNELAAADGAQTRRFHRILDHFLSRLMDVNVSTLISRHVLGESVESGKRSDCGANRLAQASH